METLISNTANLLSGTNETNKLITHLESIYITAIITLFISAAITILIIYWIYRIHKNTTNLKNTIADMQKENDAQGELIAEMVKTLDKINYNGQLTNNILSSSKTNS